MQPRHPAGQEVHLLAAAVEQTMHTTSPDNSGSHHRWHMGQLRHRRRGERLLQAQEAGPGEAGRRIAGAVAAVSSCYPDHHCHVACCCSSLAAKSQY